MSPSQPRCTQCTSSCVPGGPEMVSKRFVVTYVIERNTHRALQPCRVPSTRLTLGYPKLTQKITPIHALGACAFEATLRGCAIPFRFSAHNIIVLLGNCPLHECLVPVSPVHVLICGETESALTPQGTNRCPNPRYVAPWHAQGNTGVIVRKGPLSSP